MTRKEAIQKRISEGCNFGDWFELTYDQQQVRVRKSPADTVWVRLASGTRVTIEHKPNYRWYEVAIRKKTAAGFRKTYKQLHYFVYDYAPLV